MKRLFKKPFIFPNYQPTALEIFDRFTAEKQIKLEGNEQKVTSPPERKE